MTPSALEIVLLYSVPSLGFDESKGPPTFVFVTHEIPLNAFPYSFPEDAGFFVTNGWLGEPGNYQQRIQILSPKRDLLVDSDERPFALTAKNTPYMAVTFFTGVTFEYPGEYKVVVSVNALEHLAYPLHITEAPADVRQEE